MKSHPLQRSTQPCPITKEKSLTSHNRFPVFELFRQAMRSDAAAVTILIIMCVAAFAAVAGCQQVRYSHDVKDERTTSNELLQTASRLTWAFARDKGFIGSSRLSRIHPRWDVPIWALCANQVVIFIIGCVYLGSTTAFNAFIGTGLILQLITFAFPAALLLMRRRSARFLPDDRRFKVPSPLGFSLLCLVFWDLPATLPVEPSNLSECRYHIISTPPTLTIDVDYSCAVIGVIGLFILANWVLWAQKHYVRPNFEVLESVS
jgi:choline transport protein